MAQSHRWFVFMYLLTDSLYYRARFLKDLLALIHAKIKILSHFLYFPSYAYKRHIYRLPCINRREIKLISKQIYSIWWYIHTCYSTLQAPSQTTRWKDFRTIWLRINTFCNRIFSFFKYGYLARPAYFSAFLFVFFFFSSIEEVAILHRTKLGDSVEGRV